MPRRPPPSSIERFAKWPEIASRVKAYVRVAGRRWDLQLDNGVAIKLPEHDVDRAMQVLSTMDEGQQLLSNATSPPSICGSRTDRIQLTPEAAARRQVALEARTKELKARRRSVYELFGSRFWPAAPEAAYAKRSACRFGAGHRLDQGRLHDRPADAAGTRARSCRAHTSIEIIGIGHQKSRGMKNGVIADLDARRKRRSVSRSMRPSAWRA